MDLGSSSKFLIPSCSLFTQILGVEPDADTAEIDKNYRVKKYANRNNQEMLAKIESAHNSLMLSSLAGRLKVRMHASSRRRQPAEGAQTLCRSAFQDDGGGSRSKIG